jgi:hypothetical protein
MVYDLTTEFTDSLLDLLSECNKRFSWIKLAIYLITIVAAIQINSPILLFVVGLLVAADIVATTLNFVDDDER